LSGEPSPGLMIVALILGGLILARMTTLGAACIRERGEASLVGGGVGWVWLAATGAVAFGALALHLWDYDFWVALERSRKGEISSVVVYSGLAATVVTFGLLFRLMHLLKWGIGEPPSPDELAEADRRKSDTPPIQEDADEASAEEKRSEP